MIGWCANAPSHRIQTAAPTLPRGVSPAPRSGPMRDTGPVTDPALPSQLPGILNRIPRSMAEFEGPGHGTVDWPKRLAWQGLDRYDIDDPAQRLTFYRALMDCAQRTDIAHYINAALLQVEWPASAASLRAG
jgi:hypothetical protein